MSTDKWENDDALGQDMERGAVCTQRSEIARDLRQLRGRVWDAMRQRDRVNHTLFWSLFLAEISLLKRRKAYQQLIKALLLG